MAKTKRKEITRTDKDKKLIIETYAKTQNITQTAKLLNIPKTTCYDIITKWIERNPKEYELIRTQKEQETKEEVNEIMEKVRKRILEKLDNENDNSTIAQLTTTYGILYDKQALTEGKATSNASIKIEMQGDLQDLSK